MLRLAADYVSDAIFGYGARPAKIALWSTATIVVFGLLIWFFDLVSPSPSLGSALYTSVLTFATFGLGEQLSPDGDLARGLIALEAVLGVLLSTLFFVTFAR